MRAIASVMLIIGWWIIFTVTFELYDSHWSEIGIAVLLAFLFVFGLLDGWFVFETAMFLFFFGVFLWSAKSCLEHVFHH